jgi:hypothetical protein
MVAARGQADGSRHGRPEKTWDQMSGDC